MNTPNNEEALNRMLSEPSEQLIRFMKEITGDITILGANGKIGISLALLAKSASDQAGANKQIYAVSRFSDIEGKNYLESWGIKTIVCDLLERRT